MQPWVENDVLGVPGQNEAFHDLVARLAAAKVENEVLRRSLTPALTQGMGRIMMEQITYAWMGSVLAGIKEYREKD